MSDSEYKRKLTAILSADVAGYSRLMGADESGTVRTLTAYKQIISSLIQKQRGRVIDSPGDNMLAEFASAVDAVQCAMLVQRELAERNLQLPDGRKMKFRIGVNLGDVICQQGRIYGNGVNVAARIESLAEPGQVFISESVKTTVGSNLDCRFEFNGEHAVKNIARPIKVYRILTEPPCHPKQTEDDSMQFKLPDRPSIAVLPFTNMSADPEQEYFSDGITEDIITALSRSPWLFVISRNSSFTYRGKAVDVKKVSRELGVRYVLEGSVRKAGNRIRVTAQLIDGITGDHVWAEKYDGELEDIFDLQDRMTQEVVASTQTSIHLDLGTKIRDIDRPDVKIWDLLAKGWRLLYELNAESFEKAQKVLLKAIEFAPDSCDAHWLLGSIFYHQALMGYSTDQDKDLEEGYRLTRKAVALNEHNEYAHWILGLVELRRGDRQRSISEHRRALELNPNCALAYGGLGNAMCYSGNTEESIENSKLAIRFSPKDISIFFRFGSIAMAHFIAGRYEQAEVWARKSVQRKPSYLQGRAALIVALIHLNRLEEAKKAVAKYIEMEPNATTARAMKYMPFKELEWEERFRDGLRKAGMPE